MRRWLQDNPTVKEKFLAAPITAMTERLNDLSKFPAGVKDALVPQTDPDPCAGSAAISASLAACAAKLIERVVQWTAMSPASRAVMEANPDHAVDAVATGAFPPEAVLLVKSAFQAARRIP
jgi:hypothetical protein